MTATPTARRLSGTHRSAITDRFRPGGAPVSRTVKHAHGDEAVRVNLEGALKQLNPAKGSFMKAVKSTHEFFSGFTYANERTLMTELGKQFPVKSFERTMRGVGKSSEWLLEIGYLTRAVEALPPRGVRFGAIITIEDREGVAPV